MGGGALREYHWQMMKATQRAARIIHHLWRRLGKCSAGYIFDFLWYKPLQAYFQRLWWQPPIVRNFAWFRRNLVDEWLYSVGDSDCRDDSDEGDDGHDCDS